MVAHPFNPRTQERKTGTFLSVQGQPVLRGEFQNIWGYREILSQKGKKKKKVEVLPQLRSG